MSQYWHQEKTKDGMPVAALYDQKKLVAKIYLSEDFKTLRIVLPEMTDFAAQVTCNTEHQFIDFRRNV
jgi:hypothetical protein